MVILLFNAFKLCLLY